MIIYRSTIREACRVRKRYETINDVQVRFYNVYDFFFVFLRFFLDQNNGHIYIKVNAALSLLVSD